MFDYDFENKNYDVRQAVEDAKTKPEVALWFTNRIRDFELTKVFTRAWCEAMEKKEIVERLSEVPEEYVTSSEEIVGAMEKVKENRNGNQNYKMGI